MVNTYLEQLEENFREFEGKEAKFEASKAQAAIDDGEELLDSLRREVSDMSDKARKDEVQKKMQAYKDLIGKLKRQILTGGGSGGGADAASLAASMNGEERAKDGLEKLKEANRQLAETEAVGTDTLDRLQQQRDTIQRINNNTKDINSNLTYSNKLLTRMSKWWRG